VEGEDIVCGFELGDSYEANLVRVSNVVVVGSVCSGQGEWVLTCLLPLFAALMRDDMLAIFSASCFARWGFICMSSAIVGAAS
jgi:hypothetical protein